MRPKAFPLSFIFVLTGYALNPDKSQFLRDLPLLFLVYSILLYGGTTALNTHYDNDEGPLNFLENPPPKPKFLGKFGIAAMVLGIVISYFVSTIFFYCSLAAFPLSILYNMRVPPLRYRGKEYGGLDSLINALGCGIIAVLMGASVSGQAIQPRTYMIGLAYTITVLGSYPATQIFQLKPDDTYEKARNFSTLFGASNALKIGAIFLAIGLGVVLCVIQTDLQNTGWEWRQLFYVPFVFLFARGIFKFVTWSRHPFRDPELNYRPTIMSFLIARLFWIAAEWLR